MKKLLAFAAAMGIALTACAPANDAPSAEVSETLSLDAFATALESDYYVQEGTFAEFDTLEMASIGQLTTCFGNNNGAHYQVVTLPPAPEQDAAKGVPQLNWADETPTIFDDPNVENAPANPFFPPAGWSFKLRPDEAIVLMYELPPESEYFALAPYMMMSGATEGQNFDYDKYHITLSGSEEVGDYNIVFGSLGDQLNEARFASTAPEGEAPNGHQAVIVYGGDNITNAALVDELVASGIPETAINLYPLPSQTLNMGLQKGADTFTILGRVTQPLDEAAYDEFQQNLSQSQVFRITPKVEDEVELIPMGEVIVRGTGVHESLTIGYARNDLETIRQEIIDEYTAQGYKYIDHVPHISVPDGITSIHNVFNGKGDNRDASYLSTDYFAFNNPDDMFVVYGVNHTKTGKASYSNAVLYGVDKLNGVASVYDEMYEGSAEKYLPDGYHDQENYYVYKFDRYGTDPYSAKVPYSTGNEDGKFYGVDDGQTLVLAFRAYVEPATGVGPSYDEIVYDKALYFYK